VFFFNDCHRSFCASAAVRKQGFFLCSTDYPGEYDFEINFGETTASAPKSAQYTVREPTCPISLQAFINRKTGSRACNVSYALQWLFGTSFWAR